MVTDKRTRKRTAVGALLALLTSVSFLIIIYYRPEGQLSKHNHILAVDENEADADFWKYAYVIVSYHKSGHHLSSVLRGYLEKHAKVSDFSGGHFQRNLVSPRSRFNVLTKCSELSLEPGTITIIEAPEFHCNDAQLAELLMKNANNEEKLGVKFIHLVRNPFSMAVSNYHYHSQDPTPEPFVHWKDPCSQTRKDIATVADLVIPILSDPTIGIHLFEKVPPRRPIMTRDDFDNIADGCYDIYQTRPGLTNATYHEHLLALHPREGLRLTTADKWNHFALMASDLIMLNRVQQLVRVSSVRNPWRHQKFDLIIMPMDDWIQKPGESMYKFLHFAFRNHMRNDKKKNLSNKYEKFFHKKKVKSNHITSGKHADTAELIDYLREDAVFGGPLERIESLLDDAMMLR